LIELYTILSRDEIVLEEKLNECKELGIFFIIFKAGRRLDFLISFCENKFHSFGRKGEKN
jgi:hypothetical protein